MALSSAAKENIALKKLVGKAHTHNSIEAFAEPKTTGLTQSTSTIFSDSIPTTPDSSALYARTNNVVEYVRLEAYLLNIKQILVILKKELEYLLTIETYMIQ